MVFIHLILFATVIVLLHQYTFRSNKCYRVSNTLCSVLLGYPLASSEEENSLGLIMRRASPSNESVQLTSIKQSLGFLCCNYMKRADQLNELARFPNGIGKRAGSSHVIEQQQSQLGSRARITQQSIVLQPT